MAVLGLDVIAKVVASDPKPLVDFIHGTFYL